jgi:hypothetical protein
MRQYEGEPMRRLLLLTGALLLSACGSNSEDFTVDVAMAPDQAKAELAQLDGGLALRALSLPSVTADAATKGELNFALPGDEESGRLHLTFEEVGKNQTRIHVALALPSQIATIQGKAMMLSEDKAERVIQDKLRAWADGVTTSGYASLDGLNEALGGMSIAMRSKKLNEVLAAADDPSQLAGLIDPQVLAEMDGGGDFAPSGGLDAPMADPASDAADAAGPMDLAEGSEDASQPMDTAVGEDASGDWASNEF